METVLAGIIVGIFILFGIRLFGAWLLRINIVIREQKKTNEILVKYLNAILNDLRELNKEEDK